MGDKNKPKKKEEIRRVAPGFNDEKFGEAATPEDRKNGNYTKVARVFLDENDPS